jgi:hypothetical protein
MGPIFTDEEKVQIRHALGYQQGQLAYTFVLGVPASVQSQFPIEVAMDKILPEAAGLVRRHLQILERIEFQGVEDYELMAVSQIDEIHVNPDEHKKLFGNHGYMRWRASLANLFGIAPNPYDMRFTGMGTAGINSRVQHG